MLEDVVLFRPLLNGRIVNSISSLGASLELRQSGVAFGAKESYRAMILFVALL